VTSLASNLNRHWHSKPEGLDVSGRKLPPLENFSMRIAARHTADQRLVDTHDAGRKDRTNDVNLAGKKSKRSWTPTALKQKSAATA
jgi:hypothetical protein